MEPRDCWDGMNLQPVVLHCILCIIYVYNYYNYTYIYIHTCIYIYRAYVHRGMILLYKLFIHVYRYTNDT